MTSTDPGQLAGIVFSKQFPNAEEPLRGLFVAEQVRATSHAVAWSVIAPAPYAPSMLSGVLPRPHVSPTSTFDGIEVRHPGYQALPRRLAYLSVGRSMTRAARPAFQQIVAHAHPAFVHVHTLYPAGAAGRVLAIEAGLPYVVTVHGSDLYSNMRRASWVAELRRVVDDAAAVVGVSASIAHDVVRMLGARPERTLVIPNSFDETLYVPGDRPAGPGPRLLTVGRLVDVKGHRFLIDALADLVPSYPDIRLRVIGEGPLRGRLEQMASERGLGDRVEFPGALPPNQLAEEFRAADLFVLPSVREGFGVVLLEALASGTGVVATRSGGPESIVEPGLGELVTPADARDLARGIAHELETTERTAPAQMAARVRERFGRDAVGERLVTLYREVAAGNPLTATLAEEAAR